MVKYYGDRGMLAFEATAPGGENNPPNPFVNRSDLVEWEKATGVRVFCKEMWYGFAGCSLFGKWDGTLSDVRKKAYDAAWRDARNHPVYREIGEWVVIVDGSMVGAYGSVDDDGNSLQFGLDMAFPNQKAAAAFLSLLPADFEPDDFGFDSF